MFIHSRARVDSCRRRALRQPAGGSSALALRCSQRGKEKMAGLKVCCRLGRENRPVFVSDGFHFLNETRGWGRSSTEHGKQGGGRWEKQVWNCRL